MQLAPRTNRRASTRRGRRYYRYSSCGLTFLLFTSSFFVPFIMFMVLGLVRGLFFRLVKRFGIVRESVLSSFLFGLFDFFFRFVFR